MYAMPPAIAPMQLPDNFWTRLSDHAPLTAEIKL
jgi:endonuclease/exonuclease/phosphatase family metal-dependent hydrolase